MERALKLALADVFETRPYEPSWAEEDVWRYAQTRFDYWLSRLALTPSEILRARANF